MMRIGSKILRKCSFILGVLYFAYGFIIGVLGAGADGFHNSIIWRIVGIYVLILGISYIISNESKLKTRKKYFIYLFLELTPLVLLLATFIYSITIDGLKSFINTKGHYFILALSIMSVMSPLSLLFANKLKTSNKRLKLT